MRDPAGHQVLRLDDLPSSPWRNGGGVTRTVRLDPSTAEERWRLSVADIDRDGPFSPFAGWTRHFCVIGAAPVTLRVADTSHVVRPAETLTFDGADDAWATIPAGPTRALNLMVRAGHADGGLVVDRVAGPRTYDDALALLPIHGTLQHADLVAAPGDAMITDGRIHVRGQDATVVVARVATGMVDPWRTSARDATTPSSR